MVIRTVGELRAALAIYPDDMPVGGHDHGLTISVCNWEPGDDPRVDLRGRNYLDFEERTSADQADYDDYEG